MKDEESAVPRFFTLGALAVLVLLFTASVIADLKQGSPGRPVTFLLGSMVGAALGLNKYRQNQGDTKESEK
jgi:hypothetical protein